MTWLVPLCVFPPIASLYLGGSAVRLEGGSGPRETVGLLVTLVLFVVAFGVARVVLGPLVGGALPTVLGVLAAALLLPPSARVAFRLVGVRLVGRARDAVGTA